MTPFLQTTNNYTPLTHGVSVASGAGQIVAPGPDPLQPTRAVMFPAAGSYTVTLAGGTSMVLTIPATATGVVQYLAVTNYTAGVNTLHCFW